MLYSMNFTIEELIGKNLKINLFADEIQKLTTYAGKTGD